MGFILLCLLAAIFGVVKVMNPGFLAFDYFELKGEEIDASKPEIDVQLLTINPYSRPGIETGKINPTVLKVLDIANVLGTDLNALTKDI